MQTQPGHLRAVYAKLLMFHHITCVSSPAAAEVFARGDLDAALLPLAKDSLQPTVTLLDYYKRPVQVTGRLQVT